MAEKARIHTILRIVGEFAIVSDAVNVECWGRFGWIKVTDTAMAASSIPDVTATGESSWMHNAMFLNRRGTVDAVSYHTHNVVF